MASLGTTPSNSWIPSFGGLSGIFRRSAGVSSADTAKTKKDNTAEFTPVLLQPRYGTSNCNVTASQAIHNISQCCLSGLHAIVYEAVRRQGVRFGNSGRVANSDVTCPQIPETIVKQARACLEWVDTQSSRYSVGKPEAATPLDVVGATAEWQDGHTLFASMIDLVKDKFTNETDPDCELYRNCHAATSTCLGLTGPNLETPHVLAGSVIHNGVIITNLQTQNTVLSKQNNQLMEQNAKLEYQVASLRSELHNHWTEALRAERERGPADGVATDQSVKREDYVTASSTQSAS